MGKSIPIDFRRRVIVVVACQVVRPLRGWGWAHLL
jgi:hypothetical protein